MYRTLTLQQTPHSSPSWVSYGVSIVRILEKLTALSGDCTVIHFQGSETRLSNTRLHSGYHAALLFTSFLEEVNDYSMIRVGPMGCQINSLCNLQLWEGSHSNHLARKHSQISIQVLSMVVTSNETCFVQANQHEINFHIHATSLTVLVLLVRLMYDIIKIGLLGTPLLIFRHTRRHFAP